MSQPSTSIAVLPFRSLSPEADTEYFARGFAEDLIAQLTRFTPLRVVASQSSFALDSLDRPLAEVARAWRLDYLLEGSVRLRGDTLRIGTQLIRVDGQETVWADRFDAHLDDVFAVQDEITSLVAGTLAVQLQDARLARAHQASAAELAAYDLWLRGMDCLKQATLEGDAESRPLFHQALDLDPRYARAYAGLSLSYFNEWSCQAWHLWDESVENAYGNAAQAVAIDDSDAMVQAVLARVYRYRRQHDRAGEHAARALALNPNDPYVLIQIAFTSLFGGESERALELAERAIARNPLHPPWYAGVVGWCHFMAGRPAEALPFLAKGGESIVNFAAYRAACEVLTGDLGKARRELHRFEREYREKISFGRVPEPGEALAWAVQVEPFRHLADSRRMPEVLRQAGLADIDVEAALARYPEPRVRAADLQRPAGCRFVREGRIWSLDYQGSGAKLVELKGFHDIARLLAEPGVPIHCLELSGAPPEPESQHEVLDAEARRAYRQRFEELQGDLERAEADHDAARVETFRRELEFLVDELTRATGLGGRSRRLGDRAERARTATTWGIRSAIRKIQAAHPRLGQHLANSIRTGTFCVYSPEVDTRWIL